MNKTVIHQLCEYSKNRIFIKREDLIPLSFGGNKARKAQLFFEKIDRGDYDTVVTYGSSHSNHCRIISNMAAMRNMKCYIVGPTEVSDQTFNSDFMRLFGAEIITVPVEEVHDTIENLLEKLKANGNKPYFIAGGGHGNIGTKAYINCYEEIKSFEKENGIYFDYIFFASGTGTTQAGLVCGKLINRDKREIIGISIARKNPYGRNVVVDSIKDYFLEYPFDVTESEIETATVFLDEFTGEGYGKDNTEVLKTISEVFTNYGVPLDSTYTAKAFCGMKKYLASENVNGKNILFIHTGGTPLFFDDIKQINKGRYL